jgi:predicted nuclease of predicted toxin-antitoxin system
MRFLVDAQLPPALGRWLVAKGFEAGHVGGRGLGSASDAAIWDYATQDDFVVLTKDDDFATNRASLTTDPQSFGFGCPIRERAPFWHGSKSLFPRCSRL